MMSLAFDITENEAIKMIIRLANKELGDYSRNKSNEDYDIIMNLFTGTYPAYLAFDEKYCLITSDKKRENFKKARICRFFQKQQFGKMKLKKRQHMLYQFIINILNNSLN